MITLKIKGLEKTIRELGDISTRKIPGAIKEALEASSTFILKELKNNTPVGDTGNLKDSMRKQVGVTQAIVGPDLNIADYGVHVEYGHHTRSGSFVKGQFFIKKTAIETARAVDKIFRDTLKKALR